MRPAAPGPDNAAAVDFIDTIDGDRNPACTAADGRWAIEMIAGIYRSHFSGSRVQFPLKDRGDPFQA